MQPGRETNTIKLALESNLRAASSISKGLGHSPGYLPPHDQRGVVRAEDRRGQGTGLYPVRVSIASSDLVPHQESLQDWWWEPIPDAQKVACRFDLGLRERLEELGVTHETDRHDTVPYRLRGQQLLSQAY